MSDQYQGQGQPPLSGQPPASKAVPMIGAMPMSGRVALVAGADAARGHRPG